MQPQPMNPQQMGPGAGMGMQAPMGAPQMQQQPPQPAPQPKKDDPVAQLNEIMSRLSVAGHNN